MMIFRTLSRTERRPRARLWTALTISLAVCISACAGKQPERVSPPAVVIPAPEPPPAVVAKPPPPKPAPPKPVAKAPPVQTPPPNSPVISQVIGQVIGMSQDDLLGALGEPAERIDQGPGQAWIYKGATCTVEVLFFLDVTRNGYYALDRKVSPASVAAGDSFERACYSEIQNARHR